MPLASSERGSAPIRRTPDAAGDLLRAYAFVPRNHMAQFVAVVAYGRVRVALFHGTPLKRRSGTIWNMSVSTSDEELFELAAGPL
jgi:hypothetical protein